DEVTMAHIHMAAAGKNGPVAVWLYPTKSYPVKTGKFSGLLARGTITAAQLGGPLKGQTIADLVKEIRDGDAYVNVHTKAHPGGEIRGQIH
ncbi:MAG TPA: CHRD domain-containing protein, partial [Candidatus Dormibacteraeota bacterium]|nr:CHRD domain-containing protein [Candidatus Dormibacteraeota bacterium]